ncbi:sugar transporter ERD6-like 5 isoform X2 [Amborella trichopoda]|uniref:sugar transporter ERD6-like 5 isoform X2 n=1 Tax=Amborella trichopoda TaxID=13333 RepID=UPI0009BE1E0D|nr:sugar transporter ERD6-like 5 isoform X2 [Amborella trichopoda]|eukprot:XP_020519740.1 sugar transporter ERD6-like 5 isoform X2 [Amborella trichopoda]
MLTNRGLEGGYGIQKPEIKQPLISEAASSSCSNGDKEGSVLMVLLSTFVAVCGSFQFGCALGFSSPTQSAIRNELGLSLYEYSVFASILTIGAMVGALMCGSLADYTGRKGAMRIAAIFCLTGWVATGVSKDAWILDLGRLSVGYGIGVFSYVVPVYIAEVAPKDLRGGLGTMNQLMVGFGISTVYLLGTILTWRTLTLTGIIPSLMLQLGLILIPESPRWLAKVGKQSECELALQRLRGKDANISKEAADIEATIVQDSIKIIDSLPQAKPLDLFQRKYVYPLTVGVGLISLQQFGGMNAISFYASETFVSAGFSSTVGTILLAVMQVPASSIGALLMDSYGRRPLLMISATGTCIGCLFTAISFVLKDLDQSEKISPILALSGILVFETSVALGMGGIPYIIMSEIFPINVRGSAGSLVSFTHWFGSWVITITYSSLMSWSKSGTFFIYTGVCGATVLFAAKLVPETKGRTLEEIQASIEHSSP